MFNWTTHLNDLQNTIKCGEIYKYPYFCIHFVIIVSDFPQYLMVSEYHKYIVHLNTILPFFGKRKQVTFDFF